MKRLSLFAVVAVLALPSSAHAASVFVTELGAPYATGDASYGVITGEFNGDGRPDVAVINGTSSTLSVFLRQPGGGFVKEADSSLNLNGPSYGAAADFNGDGLSDLVIANYVTSGGYASVLTRNPTGGFSVETSLSIGSGGAGAATAADFTGDGRPDAAVAAYDINSVSVFPRLSGGGFGSEGSSSTGTNPRQLAVGDFNGDTIPDLAVTNPGSDNVTVLIRNAQRSAFVAEPAVAVGDTPAAITAANLSGDGRAELVVGNFTDGTVQVLTRNGTNTGFVAGAPVPVPAQPTGVAAADFDRNGSVDLAVSSVSGFVTIVSGATTPETPIPFERAHSLAVADFNADGQSDLAVSADRAGASVMTVLINATAPAQQPPPPPPPDPAPTPTPPLPDPVAGRNVNVTPVKGTVKVKLPKTNRYIDLAQAQQLPVGTTIDARKGTVEIKAANNGGTAKFYDGIFKIASQTKGKRPLTNLTLTEPLSCPKGKKANAAAAKKKSRRLWGDGKGSFRTTGRYSAATVRGTKWLVTDRCDTTTTKVAQGSVTVRDFVKKRNVVVRAGGKSYTARKKR